LNNADTQATDSAGKNSQQDQHGNFFDERSPEFLFHHAPSQTFSNHQSSIRDSIRRPGAFPQAVGVADVEREAQIGAR